MRVLVLWADNHSPNYGVRVLAQGMAELARRAWGQDIQINYQDFGPGESPISFGARSILRDFCRSQGDIKQRILAHDVILDSGAGDSFTDIYGAKRLSTIAYARETARRLDVPVVMGPQTIGPFDRRVGRATARRLLRASSLVLPRDSQSAMYASDLGRPVDGVSTDVVFALPRSSRSSAYDVLVNVSGLLWFSDCHGDSAQYQDNIERLVNLLLAEGRQVALIAHTVRPDNVQDDVAASRELLKKIAQDIRLIVPESLTDVRSAVASASMVVGGRMHACLNAISEGTPAIPWAYSRKFAPLLKDLGWEFVIDLHRDESPAQSTIDLMRSVPSSELDRRVASVLENTTSKLEHGIRLMRTAVSRG